MTYKVVNFEQFDINKNKEKDYTSYDGCVYRVENHHIQSSSLLLSSSDMSDWENAYEISEPVCGSLEKFYGIKIDCN